MRLRNYRIAAHRAIEFRVSQLKTLKMGRFGILKRAEHLRKIRPGLTEAASVRAHHQELHLAVMAGPVQCDRPHCRNARVELNWLRTSTGAQSRSEAETWAGLRKSEIESDLGKMAYLSGKTLKTTEAALTNWKESYMGAQKMDTEGNMRNLERRSGRTGVMNLALIAALGLLTVGFTACKDNAQKEQTAAPAPAAAPAPVALSPQDIKEMAARDTYAENLGKELHAKVPAYKNVKIFADNYVGPKSPSKTPQTDPKTRKGDNLMLVFDSPESGTARGIADFTKTPAAQQLADKGFSEVQFMDPDTHCYALVDTITGPGAVKCGPR